MAAGYATDYYGWAMETARKIRSGRLSEVDLEHLAEEIESLGKSEQQQLATRFIVLISHMLKWEFQPGRRKGGWEATIKEQRLRIRTLLDRNPSLNPLVDETIAEAYPVAVIQAAGEASMVEQDFPRTCPYSVQEILNG